MPWTTAGSETLCSLCSQDLSLLGLGTCQAHTHHCGGQRAEGERRPAPAFGGKATAQGALGGQELQRQNDGIPKSQPCHCPQPSMPPGGTSPSKHPQRQDGNLDLCPQVATCLGPPGAARLSLPEAASLRPPQPAPPRLPRPAASGWGRASFHLLLIFISSTSYNCTFQNRILRAEKPRAFGVFSLRSREKQTLIPV